MGKVKINFDYSKCPQPENCRKCLQVCPPGVFNLIFTDKKNYKDPKNWKIVPVFPQLCLNSEDCNSCIEMCPKNAISIKIKKK
jgi:NADH-quinone oxidoreductase subunit I